MAAPVGKLFREISGFGPNPHRFTNGPTVISKAPLVRTEISCASNSTSISSGDASNGRLTT